jgi:hypothetical protein
MTTPSADQAAAADYAASRLGEVPCDICGGTGKVGVESYAHGAPYTVGEQECSACVGTGKDWTDDQWLDNLASAYLAQQQEIARLRQEATDGQAELRRALANTLTILDNNNPNSSTHAGYNLDGVASDLESGKISGADFRTVQRAAKQCHDAISTLTAALARKETP